MRSRSSGRCPSAPSVDPERDEDGTLESLDSVPLSVPLLEEGLRAALSFALMYEGGGKAPGRRCDDAGLKLRVMWPISGGTPMLAAAAAARAAACAAARAAAEGDAFRMGPLLGLIGMDIPFVTAATAALARASACAAASAAAAATLDRKGLCVRWLCEAIAGRLPTAPGRWLAELRRLPAPPSTRVARLSCRMRLDMGTPAWPSACCVSI